MTAAVLYSFQLIKLDFTFSKYVFYSCSFDEMFFVQAKKRARMCEYFR